MRILGMEKLSLVDYDGKIATTLFTGNCNFRCGFCHNSPLVVDFKNLPEIPHEEIFDYLQKRKGVLEGVCISGGEPTLESDLGDFCYKIKQLDYPIKLDTNGTNPSLVKNLVKDKLIDYVAMDIKNSKQNYSNVIGYDKYDTDKIEQMVEFLLSGSIDFEFRTTLIENYHDEKSIVDIGKWIKGAKKYFLQIFKQGDNCLNSKNLKPVSENKVKEFVNLLHPYVPNVKTRGYDL